MNNEQQQSPSNVVTSVANVDANNLTQQHYAQQQHHQNPMGMIGSNQIPKSDPLVDYNLHRINDATLYNQMVCIQINVIK